MKRIIGLLLFISLAGCEGPMGPAGQSIQGEQGEKGDIGDTGRQGRTGPQGEQAPPSDLTYVARFNSEDEISTWRKSDLGSWRIEDGRLILSGTGDGMMMMVGPNTYLTSDLDISVDTEWLGGEDGYAYGILFRVSSKGVYGFGIAAAGAYYVGELDEDMEAWEALSDWTFPSVINKEGKNTLRVITSGSRFEFYINGVMVNSITDDTLTEGYINLYLSNLQEVAFDNLDIKVIETNEQPLLKALSK